MTEQQKALLESLAKELNGKLSYWTYSDKNTQHKKIVIEYDYARKDR